MPVIPVAFLESKQKAAKNAGNGAKKTKRSKK